MINEYQNYQFPQVVLVTGANGFVGRKVINYLIKNGVAVRGLVRDRNRLPQEIRSQIEVCEGDINDYEALQKAVKGVDAIVHAAAYVSDYALDESIYKKVNVEGTRNLVAAAIQESFSRTIRFVHFSSSTVLPFRPNACLEDDDGFDLRPKYPYKITKIEAERIVFDAFEETRKQNNLNFEVTAIRPTFIFGPGDLTFFPSMVKALTAGTPALIGNKKNLISLVYIEI